MKHFEITLRHDHGSVTLRTLAADIESAQRTVCAAEGAPRSAVRYWRVIPTSGQVRRTKSLL